MIDPLRVLAYFEAVACYSDTLTSEAKEKFLADVYKFSYICRETKCSHLEWEEEFILNEKELMNLGVLMQNLK